LKLESRNLGELKRVYEMDVFINSTKT